jgi:hypothetical protein
LQRSTRLHGVRTPERVIFNGIIVRATRTSKLHVHRRYRETHCFHLQDRRDILAACWIRLVFDPEAAVNMGQILTIRRHSILHGEWTYYTKPSLIKLQLIRKGKAIPVTGRGGPHDCETSRLPHFLDNRLTEGGEVVSLMRRPAFTPQEDSWCSLLLEAESTSGP